MPLRHANCVCGHIFGTEYKVHTVVSGHAQWSAVYASLEIDYHRKTVNGTRAAINDTMIRWSSTTFDRFLQRNRLAKHELNRLAGTYRTEGEIGESAPPTYICEKAP